MSKAKTNGPALGCMTPPVDPAHMGDMMTSVMRAQAKMVDALLRQNIETLDFLKTRYEKDRAMLAALTEAKDPSTMMEVWTGFWSNAASDYTNEAGKLSSFAAATTEQMIEGLTEEARVMAGGAPRRGA